MSGFYNGTELLSQRDIDGEIPEIFMCTANNSAGKTTFFNRWAVKRFKKHGEKFMLIYRYNYEIDGVSEQFFNDIKELFYPDDELTHKKMDKGVYAELYLNGEACGFAVALSMADQVKRKSHLFNDVQRMIFDEFQSETNKYLPDEANKLWAIHKAVARGHGKQSRYVPVFMIANPVSMLNPYYTAMGISKRLNNQTKFLRGTGWVLEQGFNESASKALSESRFNKAFGDNKYFQYSTQGVYLNDNDNFIEKLDGRSDYLMTVISNGKSFAIREYRQHGLIYCDDRADETYPTRIAVTTSDHNSSSLLMARSTPIFATLRKYFEAGLFRFKDLECKEIILNLLSY